MVLATGRAVRSPARLQPDQIEGRLRRYDKLFQARVRALAGCHVRLAQLAVSFPALLFAMAAPPRPGVDTARAIARTISGAPLAELAAVARIPLWLRKLPPEAFVRPIPDLPDGKTLRRRIANHLPAVATAASTWLQAVADAAEWAHENVAVWIARELTRPGASVPLDELRLIALFAWFSGQAGTRGHRLIDRPWSLSMRFRAAEQHARQWYQCVALELDLGPAPIVDMWLDPDSVDGYDFVPLRTVSDIAEEAVAMRNCLRGYGSNVAHNRSRIWSVRRQGQRVATLEVGLIGGDPLLTIAQLFAADNEEVPPEVAWAARRWLHGHDLLHLQMKRFDWHAAPLHQAHWIAMWRPYWLAKRRIPAWLPLRPSRATLNSL
jgi:hypothetical protein